MLDGLPVWIGFNAFVLALLILDLKVLNKTDHVVGMRQAAYLTAFWWGVAVVVGIGIFVLGTTEQGINYTTAFVVEKALSVDNLFVFLVIFTFFKLPPQYQLRALLFGILGALIARAIFILLGLTIIGYFSWVMFILGAFLIYTAYKLAFVGSEEVDPKRNPAVRLFRRFMPVTDEYDGHNFFTRLPSGARAATPFLLVIVAIGTTDIVFAIDSIPTVFGITTDPFVVWSSNAMAVLGLRPLFFLLSGLVNLFRFLQTGLAVVLGFIGVKMIAEESAHTFDIHLPGVLESPFFSLGIILSILTVSVIASKLIPQKPDDDSASTHGPDTVARIGND